MHTSSEQAVFKERCCYLPGTPKLGTALPQQQTLALMFTMPGSLHLAQWVGFCWSLWAKLGCARPQKHLRGVEPTFIMSSVLHLHCICKLTQTFARGEACCHHSLNLAVITVSSLLLSQSQLCIRMLCVWSGNTCTSCTPDSLCYPCCTGTVKHIRQHSMHNSMQVPPAVGDDEQPPHFCNHMCLYTAWVAHDDRGNIYIAQLK